MGSFRRLFQIAIVEHGWVRSSRAGRHLGMQRFNRDIIRRPAVCDHGGVGVELRRRGRALGRGQGIANPEVLKSARVGRRMRQRPRKWFAAFDRGLAPYILLHSLRRRDPWTTGLAPSRRTRNRLFHSQLIGKRGRVFERILPLRRHVGQAMVHHLGRGQGGVEVLKPTQPHAMHPLQIELDAFLADVAIHPVPPDSRLRRIRRLPEAPLQRVAGILTDRHAGHEREDESKRNCAEQYWAVSIHVNESFLQAIFEEICQGETRSRPPRSARYEGHPDAANGNFQPPGMESDCGATLTMAEGRCQAK